MATIITFAFIAYLCVINKCLIRLVALLCCFCLGVGIFSICKASFEDTSFEAGIYTVSGRICNVTDYSGSQSVILNNVYLNGEKTNKNMIVMVNGGEVMETGYILTFTEYIEKTELFSLGEFNSYYYKYKIAYSARVDDSSVTIDNFSGLTLSENLRKSIKNILSKNMDNQSASISYASLFGDKSYIPSGIKDDFSISGIGHMLAVSGLHVGFVTSLFLFLLNKTKLKRYINIIIISVVLLFYAYLCDFSVSVVRASIMFLVLSISGIFGKQYDKLNSLGIAGFCVLALKPLSVFDPGFLLSFSSVLSIFMFYNIFVKFLKKCHFWNKLAQTLAMIFSVQLGILPLTIFYYGKFSILSFVANFICIPIFEIFFMIIFVLSPIVMLFSFLGFLLKIPAIILSFIIKIAQIISSQRWAVINLEKLSPFLLLGVYLIFFVCSHFVNMTKKRKICNSLLTITIFLIITLGMTTPIKYCNSITNINAYGNYSYIFHFNEKTYCISDLDKYIENNTQKYFNNIVYCNPDYIFNTSQYKSKIFNNVYEFGDDNNEKVLKYNTNYIYGDIKIQNIKIGDNVCGIMIEYNNLLIFIVDKDITFNNLYTIYSNYGKFDLIFTKGTVSSTAIIENNISSTVINGDIIYKNNILPVKMSGNWTFDFLNGNIENIRGIN